MLRIHWLPPRSPHVPVPGRSPGSFQRLQVDPEPDCWPDGAAFRFFIVSCGLLSYLLLVVWSGKLLILMVEYWIRKIKVTRLAAATPEQNSAFRFSLLTCS
jgi:hypothetical protein